jgi:hypothetical protein
MKYETKLFTTCHAVKDLQHRLFTDEHDKFDCSESPSRQLIEALKITETAVNKAIEEGASEVKIKYVNILDVEQNPDGHIGRIRVVGYRSIQANVKGVAPLLAGADVETGVRL